MIKAPRTNKLERKEKKGKEREGKGMRGEGKGGEEQDRWEGKGRNRNYAKRGNLGVPSRPSIHAGLPLIRRLWLN